MKPEPKEKKVLRSSANAEPLKGKGIDKCELPFVGKMYSDEDIKSAVEWLKENIKSQLFFRAYYNDWIKVEKIIDEAFEEKK